MFLSVLFNLLLLAHVKRNYKAGHTNNRCLITGQCYRASNKELHFNAGRYVQCNAKQML